jgi:hypothetical protein
MRIDLAAGCDAAGLWDSQTRSIVIRRDQLASLSDFAGTLLHEIVHAKTGFADVTREFETALTLLMGRAAEEAISAGAPKTKSFMSGLFGR